MGRVAEQHRLRPDKIAPGRAEHLGPAIVDLAEHAGDEITHLVFRRAGRPRRGRIVALILCGRSAAAENFRAADQNAWIDAESISEDTEHQDGADPEPAT